MDKTVARVLNAAGIAAPVLWVAAVVYIGSLRPEYSHARQYISELAARGSPNQHLMQVAGFILPGLMVVAFGLLVGLSARTKLAGAGAALLIVGGIARITAGVFPLDPCCLPMPPSFTARTHNAAGMLHVVTMCAAVVIWCAVGEAAFRTRGHWFRWYSLATFVAAITLPWWLMRSGIDASNVGLFQRVSLGVLNLWLLVFAVSLANAFSYRARALSIQQAAVNRTSAPRT